MASLTMSSLACSGMVTVNPGSISMALAMAKELISTKRDQELHIIEKVFCYLPLEHSEVLEDQEESCRLYLSLIDEADTTLKDHFKNFYSYAQKHMEIVKRFGRFPHRNEILNRISTSEEVEFLAQPGSSF